MTSLYTQQELAGAIADALDVRESKKNWFQKNLTLSVVLSFVVIVFAVVQAVSLAFADVGKNTTFIAEMPRSYVSTSKFDNYKKAKETEKNHTINKINTISTDLKELSAEVKALVTILNKNEVDAHKRDSALRSLIINQGRNR